MLLFGWFVTLPGGFHGGVNIGSFVVVFVVVFGGDARGGWCWFFMVMLVVFGACFWDFRTLVDSGDHSGSQLRYDPSTNQTTVLLSNLAVPTGVAISRDGSFALVSEFLTFKVWKVWLKGPRANSSELFMLLAGRPNNIKRNSRGQFWISVNSFLGRLQDVRLCLQESE
ncbi:strictosidine synthase [Medicago truncatula]|uniref:Strictosidine synthase n=1 Tax=Medicago truncatula TaxID=3880 RepID=G7JT54_MEDTR|nr:strictosidine synthase [Medicago truncatula]